MVDFDLSFGHFGVHFESFGHFASIFLWSVFVCLIMNNNLQYFSVSFSLTYFPLDVIHLISMFVGLYGLFS